MEKIERRIRTCLLLEKMKQYPEFSSALRLEDVSQKQINQDEKAQWERIKTWMES